MLEDKSKCPYLGYCQQTVEDCPMFCDRFTSMKHLLNNCGMPDPTKFLKKLKAHKLDIEAFKELTKIKDNSDEFISKGNNLYIYSGNLGNGKTTWAMKIMYKYFDIMWPYEDLTIKNTFRGFFIHTPTLTNMLKIPEIRSDKKFKFTTESLYRSDVVVWDDIACTNLTSTDQANILSYLDNRILMGRSNIFTGNLFKEDLELAVGKRLYSRIWDNSIRIQLKGLSFRGLNDKNFTSIE